MTVSLDGLDEEGGGGGCETVGHGRVVQRWLLLLSWALSLQQEEEAVKLEPCVLERLHTQLASVKPTPRRAASEGGGRAGAASGRQ